MAFYDLSQEERKLAVKKITEIIAADVTNPQTLRVRAYFAAADTYIRKTAYLAVGRLYFSKTDLQKPIVRCLKKLGNDPEENVRQTAVNALGEIGKRAADQALPFFEQALLDSHHKVRNAVIGSLKKMGEKNPRPVLAFSKKFLHHPDPEVRRQAVHGIELRGRTHPEEVLPLLQTMQNEKNRRVRNMVIHVLGQISYKPGCLETVVAALASWPNRDLVKKALQEIIETHQSYRQFSAISPAQARRYIYSIAKLKRI